MPQKLYGGLEFGGTKTICAIGDANGTIIAQTTISTTSVDETLQAVSDFFAQNAPVDSIGVGSFGPLNLDPSSAEFGAIHHSPKPGWSNVNLKNLLEARLKIPVSIDTDVNCAALGEYYYGVATQVDRFVYLTVGTGIGGGLLIDGKPFHRRSHLEIGHMRIPHEPFSGEFQGACPFHADCLEGIASGHAMEQRWGKRGEHISDDQPWKFEATYLGFALNNLMLALAPEKIVLGGGIMNHPGLIELVRSAVHQNINDYMDFPDLEAYIVKASGNTNGVLGAIKLASQ